MCGFTCLYFRVLYKCIHQDCIGKECDIYVRIYYIWRKIRDWEYDISKMQLSLFGMQKCLYFEKIGIAFRLQNLHFSYKSCISYYKLAFRLQKSHFVLKMRLFGLQLSLTYHVQEMYDAQNLLILFNFLKMLRKGIEFL